jgi:hypothetical protein
MTGTDDITDEDLAVFNTALRVVCKRHRLTLFVEVRDFGDYVALAVRRDADPNLEEPAVRKGSK